MKKLILICILTSLLSTITAPTKAINAHPETNEPKIGLLYPLAFGLVFILDLQNQLVCAPHSHLSLKKPFGHFYQTIAPRLIKSDDIGQPTSPNIESLLRVRPDLMIVSNASEYTSSAVTTLEQNGIAVVRLNAGFGTVAEWLEAITSLAEITGKVQRAQAYKDFYQSRIELVSKRLASVPRHERPKVALINTNGIQMIIRGSRTTFGYELIELAGGRTMERGDDPTDSAGCAELLFAFDPDIIIDDSKIDVFYKSEWWNYLRAVKENRIYKTPADDEQAWVTNWFLGTYSPIGLLWLAKKIHPEKFADIDLKEEHAEFCRLLYNREMPHSGPGFN